MPVSYNEDALAFERGLRKNTLLACVEKLPVRENRDLSLEQMVEAKLQAYKNSFDTELYDNADSSSCLYVIKGE